MCYSVWLFFSLLRYGKQLQPKHSLIRNSNEYGSIQQNQLNWGGCMGNALSYLDFFHNIQGCCLHFYISLISQSKTFLVPKGTATPVKCVKYVSNLTEYKHSYDYAWFWVSVSPCCNTIGCEGEQTTPDEMIISFFIADRKENQILVLQLLKPFTTFSKNIQSTLWKGRVTGILLKYHHCIVFTKTSFALNVKIVQCNIKKNTDCKKGRTE